MICFFEKPHGAVHKTVITPEWPNNYSQDFRDLVNRKQKFYQTIPLKNSLETHSAEKT